jgi:hypothetical protein
MSGENATCFCRSTRLVVEPHSMSTVPFCTSGMRLAEVTAWYLMSMAGIFSSVFSASTMRLQISML